jgi:hypothetical protein
MDPRATGFIPDSSKPGSSSVDFGSRCYRPFSACTG